MGNQNHFSHFKKLIGLFSLGRSLSVRGLSMKNHCLPLRNFSLLEHYARRVYPILCSLGKKIVLINVGLFNIHLDYELTIRRIILQNPE